MVIQSQLPSGAAGIIEALKGLLRLLLDNYGPIGTLLIIVGVMGAATAFRVWRERSKDKKFNAALDEKERTIQRLSLDVRMYKVLFFMQKMGWDEDEATKFVVGNELRDNDEGTKQLSPLRRLARLFLKK